MKEINILVFEYDFKEELFYSKYAEKFNLM